jgi:AcrR family transcriptional regulator
VTAGAARAHDAGRTRSDILAVATRVFARQGFNGARVDEIAARTRTTKRMIYYYFGDKRGLYVAVLEQAYTELRTAQRGVDVAHLPPVEAVRALAERTFDHDDTHRDLIRLVVGENVHDAAHIRGSDALARLGDPALHVISRILADGRASGDFATEADAVDVHMLIGAFCFFRIANQHSFAALFGRDMTAPDHRARLRRMAGDMVVAYLRGGGAAAR